MGHHPVEVQLALQFLTTLSLSRVFQVGVFLQGLRSNLMADLFWLFQKRWASIFYVRILKIIRGGIYFISMVFTSYCAEILVWQLKYFSWTEANVKSAQSTGTAKGSALNFITQVNLANFRDEREVKIVMVTIELGCISWGSAEPIQ